MSDNTFIERLHRHTMAVESLRNLLSNYKQKPASSSQRLSELADIAGWQAVDTELPKKTRQEYLTIARAVDILLTGKTQRPATLPRMRRAWISHE